MSLNTGVSEWDVGPGNGTIANEPIGNGSGAQPATSGSEDHSGANLGGGNGEADVNGANDGGYGNTGYNGTCFNCGQEGHMKSECKNEKVAREFSGECRACGKEGHRASDCPDAKPRLCKNCNQEGHDIRECKNARVVDQSSIPTVAPEVAWQELKDAAAADDFDVQEVKDAIAKYVKGVPETTYHLLEQAFRRENIKVYMIAQERELAPIYTNMDFQGNLDRKYSVSYRESQRAKRPREVAGWPGSPEENLERLKDAGEVVERGMELCTNCEKLGHTKKSCPEEQRENTSRTVVSCVHCAGEGHRARDCPAPRIDKFACRNCKRSGHSSKECPEPRSAEGVECKRCNEIGHFAKDCPTGGERKCNNCDEPGHMSKECPKPRDYSRIRCSNCEQMGHTKVKCKAPKVSEDPIETCGDTDNDLQYVGPEQAEHPVDALGGIPARNNDTVGGW